METIINGECILIDVDEIWCEEFARWDCLVPTELAVAIASAVDKAIRDWEEAH